MANEAPYAHYSALTLRRHPDGILEVVMGAAERSLKSQMRQASAMDARYALILGAGEMADGTVSVRDLTTSEQARVPAGEVKARISV